MGQAAPRRRRHGGGDPGVLPGRIAHFKIPRYVKFVDEFPMTVTGKVQKYLMREQSIAELDLRRHRMKFACVTRDRAYARSGVTQTDLAHSEFARCRHPREV